MSAGIFCARKGDPFLGRGGHNHPGRFRLRVREVLVRRRDAKRAQLALRKRLANRAWLRKHFSESSAKG